MTSDWHIARAAGCAEAAYLGMKIVRHVIHTGAPDEPREKVARDVENIKKWREAVNAARRKT